MDHRRAAKPDAERLPDQVATRLLERASELDAAGRAGAAVTDLRAAAAEAGISAHAFDAALAELQAQDAAALPDARGDSGERARWRPMLLGGTVAVLLATVSLVVGRLAAPAAAPLVTEAILLRCLTGEQAAALVRPVLAPDGVVIVNARTPQVLTIRAPQPQLQQARAVLDKYEGSGGQGCPVPAPAP